ncbi:MAG: LpxL/LpxP family Kdo(2)-lipid IV(A) lauroyl/palmitoleoyl acyltransferase [Woeseiaceae bacterium]|nr:LpxL/LpxP family Kdo(2)-lipid IV(A) lauroyl/palmitoleoyl acyltransferase [Woeseiaceae bacterium]
MPESRRPLRSFIAPSTWPVWFGLGVLRLVCLLPHGVALGIGRGIGRLAHRAAGSRRAIVRRNIELCFPDLSDSERDKLALEHFEALGMSLIEMGLARFASDAHHQKIARLKGKEHLSRATESGQGVILLSAHFTTLEISGRVLALECGEFDAVYRRNRSPFITEILRTGREKAAANTIEKRDIKSMVRSLKQGRPVWYAPDQSYDRKGSEVIDFFGVPSMHTTATSTLARLGKATVLPFFPLRKPDGSYVFEILPPMQDFPSGDPVQDTKAYVAVLEEHIRRSPEQYFWVHKKFKNLPSSYPDYYSDLDSLK